MPPRAFVSVHLAAVGLASLAMPVRTEEPSSPDVPAVAANEYKTLPPRRAANDARRLAAFHKGQGVPAAR